MRVEGAHDTHQALRGSSLKVLEGMGHDLPEALFEDIVGELTTTFAQFAAAR